MIEIALSRDIVEVEWIGVGLIRKRGAVAHHDHESAGAQHLRSVVIVSAGRLAYTKDGGLAEKDGERNGGSSRQSSHL